MSLKLAPGVSLKGISPQLLVGLLVASGVTEEYGQDATVTSCTDGTHGFGSLHYVGHAFDMRRRDLDAAQAEEVLVLLRERLGGEWDVLLEKDHFHAEWQPKR